MMLNPDQLVIIEPLGYDEARHELFLRDNLIRLAGDDCIDLISTCRKLCHNLAIKNNQTCNVRGLIQKMDVLP
jgi:hypothetical protein